MWGIGFKVWGKCGVNVGQVGLLLLFHRFFSLNNPPL